MAGQRRRVRKPPAFLREKGLDTTFKLWYNLDMTNPSPYTPYATPTVPPFALWLDLPFRTRGSTALRAEAKGRGARYCPQALGAYKWWIPWSAVRRDPTTLPWLNTHSMIRGERSEPTFNPNAVLWSDVDTTRCRLWLRVPYADRAAAKGAGARWDASSRKWYYGRDTLTEARFNDAVLRKWADLYAGGLRSTGTVTAVSFWVEDLGGATATPPQTKSERSGAWRLVRDVDGCSEQAVLQMTLSGDTVDICSKSPAHLGVNAWGENTVNHVVGAYTLPEGRAIWGALTRNGWRTA